MFFVVTFYKDQVRHTGLTFVKLHTAAVHRLELIAYALYEVYTEEDTEESGSGGSKIWQWQLDAEDAELL